MRISDWSSDVCSSDLKRGKADKDVPARNQMTPEEQEARRNRLKVLIKLGKDRGYLTYGEINDHLPDDLVDAEAIDGILSTFSDMGISVYDQAPDHETLLMSDNAPVAKAEEPRSGKEGGGTVKSRVAPEE